ncbi:sigma-70 family RNA polymerase sigma factor [Lactobacillus psittaci]|uniref:Sigma-70 family RNA polymerase sigma factor n=1 Tax=Lactobacillus psittaci DSM 15354 TaxID=1122152 RepID=A0A0R1RYG9_9LACO|nr:sigma-70 family RNA polymerase sigma factor [Lactobacillus psittaci]KRL62031.1 hypothetical protein FC23_GL000407 [Lactobacillus psittaci DSM 15354]
MQMNPEYLLTAWQDRKLVFGALKKAHVPLNYSAYEDLVHDGIIIYAQTMEENRDKAPEKQRSLAFGRVLWHTIDHLRRNQAGSGLFMPLAAGMDEVANPFERSIQMLIFEELLPQLTPLERIIFKEHLLEKVSLKDLAVKHRVNLRTLRRRKRDLLNKLRVKLAD